MRRSRGRVALGLLAWLLTGAALADTCALELANGDRLTGRVVAETQTELVLETALGTITVPKTLIRSKTPVPPAPTPPTRPGPRPVAPEPDTSVPPSKPAAPLPPSPAAIRQQLEALTSRYRAGSISPEDYHRRREAILAGAPEPPPASVTEPGQPAPRPCRAVALKPPGPSLPAALGPFLQTVHGKTQVGVDLGFGTKDRQLYTGQLQATHVLNRLQNTLDYLVAYGKADQTLSANRMDGALRTTFDLGRERRVYLFNKAAAGYDQVRKIDLSYEEGAGLGYKLVMRPNLLMTVETGGQFHEYRYADGTAKDSISVTFGESVVWKITPKLTLTEKLQFLPDINDFADYRVRLDVNLSYPLWKQLTLNLNVIDLYDSRPPADVRRNDLTLQAAVGYTF